jgi:hypothetical protein
MSSLIQIFDSFHLQLDAILGIVHKSPRKKKNHSNNILSSSHKHSYTTIKSPLHSIFSSFTKSFSSKFGSSPASYCSVDNCSSTVFLGSDKNLPCLFTCFKHRNLDSSFASSDSIDIIPIPFIVSVFVDSPLSED